MKPTVCLPLAVSVVLLSGCTVTRSLAEADGTFSYAIANERLEGRVAMIHLLDDETIRVNHVRLGPDSVEWISDDGVSQIRALSEVKQIYYERPGRGVFIGAGFGAVLGLAIGLTPSEDKKTKDISMGLAEGLKPLAIVAMGLTCAVFGAVGEGTGGTSYTRNDECGITLRSSGPQAVRHLQSGSHRHCPAWGR